MQGVRVVAQRFDALEWVFNFGIDDPERERIYQWLRSGYIKSGALSHRDRMNRKRRSQLRFDIYSESDISFSEYES